MSWLTWVPGPIHPDALDALAEIGDVALGFGSGATAYGAVAADVNAVVLRSSTFGIDDMVLAPALKIIARHGVGHDTVDLPAATERGIPVTVTAGANAVAVAEHAMALILSVARGVTVVNGGVREGDWVGVRRAADGMELRGATLGLYGFGQIGSRVAELARGFGMTVLASDPGVTQAQATAAGVRLVSPDELLASAHVVSLHLPLLPSTRGLIGEVELARMARGAVIVNTSRGGIIDEAALAAAVSSGHLRGAGLDVVADEPLPADSPLLAVSSIVLTPHIGGQTSESMRRTGLMAAESVAHAARGESLDHVVNGLS